MAIVTNNFTTQKPMSTTGLTGAQLIKLIPAPRVFVKTAESATAATVPTVKADGATPSGWTDLGSVAGNARVIYEKRVKEVRTGIDNYLRAAYNDQKSGNVEFSLNQLDDVVMEEITGLTASVIQAGSSYTIHLGQEDLTELALLLVVQNKLDGKEWQFYNPAALLNFGFEEDGDAMVVKCNAILPWFTVSGQSKEDILSMSVFK